MTSSSWSVQRRFDRIALSACNLCAARQDIHFNGHMLDHREERSVVPFGLQVLTLLLAAVFGLSVISAGAACLRSTARF
jgi:hypothetical protein